MDQQGTYRVLSLAEAKEEKGKFAKDAMQLYVSFFKEENKENKEKNNNKITLIDFLRHLGDKTSYLL